MKIKTHNHKFTGHSKSSLKREINNKKGLTQETIRKISNRQSKLIPNRSRKRISKA